MGGGRKEQGWKECVEEGKKRNGRRDGRAGTEEVREEQGWQEGRGGMEGEREV